LAVAGAEDLILTLLELRVAQAEVLVGEIKLLLNLVDLEQLTKVILVETT
jgi:hypothetical protein